MQHMRLSGMESTGDSQASAFDGHHRPGARLYRKSSGTGAKLCYMGHVLMEIRYRFGRDCQEFRVWVGIMGKKESRYVPTQGAVDPG